MVLLDWNVAKTLLIFSQVKTFCKRHSRDWTIEFLKHSRHRRGNPILSAPPRCNCYCPLAQERKKGRPYDRKGDLLQVEGT